MTQRTINTSPLEDSSTSRSSAPHRFDRRAFERSFAGTRLARRVDGGPPTRSPSGEWMQRIALDLPEAMLDALEKRAVEAISLSEVVRAALAKDGIGDVSHVAGICDGSYADDEEKRETAAEIANFDDQLQVRLYSQGGER